MQNNLDDINRREKMLMNNIGMLNDNLHAQRQIIKDKNDMYGEPARGGGRSDFNGRIIQDFDNYAGPQDQGRERHGHGFDPKVYGANGKAIEDPMSQLEKAYNNNQRGGKSPVSKPSNNFSRRNENQKTGTTPLRNQE